MSAILVERTWPYVAGLGVTAAWWFCLGRVFPSDPAGLLGASGTFASVLVGFLATSKAIIMSISTTRTYKRIQEVGYDRVLMGYIKEAIYVGLIFLIIATMGFFVDWKNYVLEESASPEDIYKIGWVLFGSTGLALYARVIGLIFKVLEKV